jgi:hypothetical protein
VLFFVSGAFAQQGRVVSGFGTSAGFGNVVFPAGRPTQGAPFTVNNNFANSFGNVIAGRPAFFNNGFLNNGFLNNGRRNFNNFNSGGGVVYVPFAYPVYGGPVYGGEGYGYGDPSQPPQQPPQNVTVVYPPQPAPMMMRPPGGPPPDVPHSMIQEYGPNQPAPAADNTQQQESTYYLLAFKDHSIYSAVGYWVQGDTLHYITTGNVHNQVSVSLVDRETTQQLNKGRGVQVNLPPSH